LSQGTGSFLTVLLQLWHELLTLFIYLEPYVPEKSQYNGCISIPSPLWEVT